MKLLHEPDEFVYELIKGKIERECKQSKFNVYNRIKNQNILANTLTKEIIILTDEELDKYINIENHCDIKDTFISYLTQHGFIVATRIDELKRYQQILSINRMIYNSAHGKIVQYKVFTTTGCNARCFYCFEEGMLPVAMTEDTAEKTVQYILDTRADKKITLYWFGGEPLCNYKVIDYICKRMRENNVEYVSKIITNSFLFDDELIKKAKDDWHLVFAQVTLDGTEKEHNKRKSYVGNPENPFARTLDNIEKLIKNNVYVAIRLNFDDNNVKDIYDLIPILRERFGKYEKYRVYLAVLSDTWLNYDQKRSKEINNYLIKEYKKLFELLIENELYSPDIYDDKLKSYYCMASNPIAATISSDGKLFTCQSCDDSLCFGTVFEGVTKPELKNQWEICMECEDKCNKCKYLPLCSPFNLCTTDKTYCFENKDVILRLQITKMLEEEEESGK